MSWHVNYSNAHYLPICMCQVITWKYKFSLDFISLLKWKLIGQGWITVLPQNNTLSPVGLVWQRWSGVSPCAGNCTQTSAKHFRANPQDSYFSCTGSSTAVRDSCGEKSYCPPGPSEVRSIPWGRDIRLPSDTCAAMQCNFHSSPYMVRTKALHVVCEALQCIYFSLFHKQGFFCAVHSGNSSASPCPS